MNLVVKSYRQKAKRLTLICQIVETYESGADRKQLVTRLYEAGVISPTAAELLFEAYGLEAA